MVPSGAAKTLAITMTTDGHSKTFPAITFPTVDPIEDINVMASEDAIVTRVGILRTISMIGTRMNAAAAPTMPDAKPTIMALPIETTN